MSLAEVLNTAGDLRLCDCHSDCRGAELVYYCGTDEADRWTNPCLDEKYSSFDFCNESLDISTRVEDLLSRVSDEEKVGVGGTSTPLSNYATGLPSVGVPYSQWWSEALHGVAVSPGVLFNKETPYATSFPQIISTSHSYNRTLFNAIGKAISTEVRAFANLGHAGLTYWTPNLNIFRDPRWGRGQETPGEDPYLTAEYVSAYVPGLQYDADLDPEGKHLKVSACCKHFAAYSLENYAGMDRHHFDANVTAQDMEDTYLPAFEACASPSAGAASCIMCSYNDINGVPACADKRLLTDLARDKWGFEGYITSDCGAVEDVYDTHFYSRTREGAVRDVLSAGMDMECGKWFDLHLQRSVNSGAVSMQQVDTALGNLMAVHMRMGRFDASGTAYDSIPWEAVNSEAHQQLAVEAARQSVVMLKNEGDALPLQLKSSGGGVANVAVIGPNADATKTMQGNYEGHAPFLISPLQAITEAVQGGEGGGSVEYALGCEIDSEDTSGFEAAVAAAGGSDAVVLVMGIDQSQEREGRDRTSIALPGVQGQLVEQVLQGAAGKPVVLVILAGGSVGLDQYKNDPRVSAVLFAGYPGQAGGVGISDVLFGEVSPSGRLTQTFYAAALVDEVSFFDMRMRPHAADDLTPASPGRGYRFYNGENVVYEFGSGLSYVSFQYAWAGDSEEAVKFDADQQASVTLTVSVTNSGGAKYTGQAAETVLLFLEPPSNAAVSGAPSKVLRGFEKVLQVPGQSDAVSFELSEQDFHLVDEKGRSSLVHGQWTARVGPLTKKVMV